MSIRRVLSFKYLLVIFYVLSVMVVMGLLVREYQGDDPPFSLSQAVVTERQGSMFLSIPGKNFQSGLSGVSVASSINEKALLWRQLADVPVREVDVEDNLALVSCYGNKLVSVDLQEGLSPNLVGSIDLPATISHIEIVGERAFVGMNRHNGFSLIDLKDPTSLKFVAHYPGQGMVADSVVDQDVVYFVDLYAGIGRIDLSAREPRPERMAPLKSPWKIALQDRKLVVATLYGEVHFFELSRGGALLEVGRYDFPVNVRGLALTEESLSVSLADGTLRVFDLSLWPELEHHTKVELPGKPMELERIPDSKSLAVGLLAGGVALIDVSRPENPVFTGHYKVSRTFRGLRLQSDKMFSTSENGLEAFSLDDIRGDEHALTAMVAQKFYQLQAWNDRIYGYSDEALTDLGEVDSPGALPKARFMVVAEDEAVSFFEQREDGQLQRVGAPLAVAGPKAASFNGRYLYILHEGGLRIMSGSPLEGFERVSELPLSGKPMSFAARDSRYFYITTRLEGLLVVDVNNPQQPKQVANLLAPQHLRSSHVAQDVLIDGSRAYVTYAAGGVHIVDISLPAKPKLLKIIETSGHARKMALYDDLLLVADTVKGLFLVDVKDRHNPLPVGSLPIPLSATQLAVVNDGLIVSSVHGGTMLLPLPQRLEGVLVVSGGEARVRADKADEGQYVYLYDERTSGKVKIAVQ